MINGSRTYVGQILDCCFDILVKFKFDMWCQLVREGIRLLRGKMWLRMSRGSSERDAKRWSASRVETVVVTEVAGRRNVLCYHLHFFGVS